MSRAPNDLGPTNAAEAQNGKPAHVLCLLPGSEKEEAGDAVVLHSTCPGGMPFHFSIHLLLSFISGLKIIDRYKIEVIVAQDPLVNGLAGWFLSKWFRRPFCVHCLSDFILNREDIPNLGLRWTANVVARFILKAADAIRVTNREMGAKIAALGVESSKIWIIPYAIRDYSEFAHRYQAAGLNNQFKGGRFSEVVLMVGHLDARYDLDMYFQAIRIVITSHPGTLFLIVGESQRVTHLRTVVDRLGIRRNLVFLGWVAYHRLPACFAGASLLAVPANYLKEAMLKPALLASRCAIPIVATDIDGIHEIVEDTETGFVVSKGDATSFAQKICYLLDNPEAAHKMGKKGSEKVKPFFDGRANRERFGSMYAHAARSGR